VRLKSSPRVTRGLAMRSTVFIGALGFGVLVGSFLLTLWLTAPGTPPANQAEPPLAAEILATYLVSDERSGLQVPADGCWRGCKRILFLFFVAVTAHCIH
jgi:hypothetical protein